MSRKFRLTCARTTYFEIELEAEDSARAEKLFASALDGDRALREQARVIGQPIHRVVDIAAMEEATAGQVAHAA